MEHRIERPSGCSTPSRLPFNGIMIDGARTFLGEVFVPDVVLNFAQGSIFRPTVSTAVSGDYSNNIIFTQAHGIEDQHAKSSSRRNG